MYASTYPKSTFKILNNFYTYFKHQLPTRIGSEYDGNAYCSEAYIFEALLKKSSPDIVIFYLFQ